MPDYANNTGRSYTNASGSVRVNNNILRVRKGKPSKVAEDVVHAYAFGQKKPVAIIEGRETIEPVKLTIALKEWELFKVANPNYKSDRFQAVVSFTEPILGSYKFNHKNCKYMSCDPSEFDGGTTAEELMDLELLPLSVE